MWKQVRGTSSSAGQNWIFFPPSQLLPSTPHYLKSNRPHCKVLELQVFKSSHLTLSVLSQCDPLFDRQTTGPASWFKSANKSSSQQAPHIRASRQLFPMGPGGLVACLICQQTTNWLRFHWSAGFMLSGFPQLFIQPLQKELREPASAKFRGPPVSNRKQIGPEKRCSFFTGRLSSTTTRQFEATVLRKKSRLTNCIFLFHGHTQQIRDVQFVFILAVQLNRTFYPFTIHHFVYSISDIFKSRKQFG